MKKNYMKPEMVIVQIKAQQALLVGSSFEVNTSSASSIEEGELD